MNYLETDQFERLPSLMQRPHLGNAVADLEEPHNQQRNILSRGKGAVEKLTSMPYAIALCSGMEGSHLSVMHHSYTPN